MSQGPVIWIEGLIGAGKSSITKELSERLGLLPFHEPVDSNPYLGLFYEDPKEWAFSMQIHLLRERWVMQRLANLTALKGTGVILDRGLPGDRVFAKMHMLAGNIHALQWETYEQWFEAACLHVQTPSLVIFLDVEPEVALERVRKRGRVAEAGMDLKYLQDLRKGYLDLLCEIDTGEHSWSRGMAVKRVPWNIDHQPVEMLVRYIAKTFEMTPRIEKPSKR